MNIYSQHKLPPGFYVYAFIRPDGTPYYIGKGHGARAYSRTRHIKPKPDFSNVVFLETGLTELGAFALERRLIRWHGRKDIGTGILYNRTDGGDGTAGLKIIGRVNGPTSEETKRKISEANKGRKLGKSWHSGKTGVYSDEVRKNWSKKRKGFKVSEETKEKLRGPKPTLTCPHCNKEGAGPIMFRYHFGKCKYQSVLPTVSKI